MTWHHINQPKTASLVTHEMLLTKSISAWLLMLARSASILWHWERASHFIVDQHRNVL